MGKKLIFLVPCAHADIVFRFSGAFHVDFLLITAGLPDTRQSLTPQLRAAIHDNIVKSTTRRIDYGLLHAFDEICKLSTGGDPGLPEPQRANCAIRDKIAISLNVARSSIVIAPRPTAR